MTNSVNYIAIGIVFGALLKVRSSPSHIKLCTYINSRESNLVIETDIYYGKELYFLNYLSIDYYIVI